MLAGNLGTENDKYTSRVEMKLAINPSRPNTAAILDGLKDFQRNTVDYVFRRMYLDDDRVHRFLVADEVGLGKTLVARGLIAKAIDHLSNGERRIDVVYICSNSEIARQNIERLKVTEDGSWSSATRLTLLALSLRKVSKNQVNFVAFTPDTSFALKQTGLSLERQLLYYLTTNERERHDFNKTARLFEVGVKTDRFRNDLRSFPEKYSPHSKIAHAFWSEFQKEKLAEFDEICDAMPRKGTKIPHALHIQRNAMISDLRLMLAKVSLKCLEPDFIILDEFQRFKDLLKEDQDGEGPGALAKQLFTFQDDKEDPETTARVLLLSATPYKMYTTHSERDTDDHYSDFQATLEFLLPKPEDRQSIASTISIYRDRLVRIGEDGGAGVMEAKRDIELQLKSVMTRTERLASSADRSGMLIDSNRLKTTLEKDDVVQYLAIRELANAVGNNDILAFWKSAPYLLNFMEDYDFKHKIIQNCEDEEQTAEFIKAFNSASPTLISHEAVERYARLEPANPQLRGLHQDTIVRDLWRLLWMPAARPYYQPSGPFASASAKNFTKSLIFSSWLVVPRVIASVLSYEAEREMFTSYRRNSVNNAEARKKRRPLLRYAIGKSGPTGMPVFALTYPCRFLAETFDPACIKGTEDQIPNLRITDLINHASAVIEQQLGNPLIDAEKLGGEEDRAWYWAVPLLLDIQSYGPNVKQWLDQESLNVRENPSDDDETENKGWLAHVERAKQLVRGDIQLGRPPKNLCKLVAAMAIAAPGTCALRGLNRNELTRSTSDLGRANAAHRIGNAFLHLFNLPEVTAMIRGQKRDRIARAGGKANPYWESMLRYCLHGNIQAVLDEYLHILSDSPGAEIRSTESDGSEAHDVCFAISNRIAETLTLRTASIKADTFKVTKRSVRLAEPLRFRTRFAMAFVDQKNEDDSEGSRKEQVRDAFNSPFWPFVLASTSVGQEGLDFHRYCHSIVHWNLPSNPVDLEQREGRIHRYKGHALRKNIAYGYGESPFEKGSDVWETMFNVALANRKAGGNDLHPYWISDDGPARIERHTPMLPLSRELKHKEDLLRSLTVYRLVFGQNRQEDLVQFLLGRVDPSLIESIANRCHIDLAPPGNEALP